MAFQFPWTNFHELNLDWFLSKFKQFTNNYLETTATVELIPTSEQPEVTVTGGTLDDDTDIVDPFTFNFKLPVNSSGGGAVNSVNGKVGDVVLDKTDIGLGNVANVTQYSASNPPPYPVTSVNGQTGDVSIPATVIDANPTQNSTNAVSSGGVWTDINTITNLTENNIAWVETTTIASRTYNINDYVIINGVLCKITATVASGSTLISGTNYTVLGGNGGISNDISSYYYTAQNPFTPTASDTAQTIIAKAITTTVAKITSGYAYFALSYPNHSWGCDVQVFVCDYLSSTSLAVSGTLYINNGRSATPGEAYIFSARWDKPTSEVAALKVSNAISLSLVS